MIQPIIPIIKLGDTGTQVGNLQDALLALLDRQFIQVFDPPNRPTREELQALTEELKVERDELLYYGQATSDIVTYFQIQQGRDNLDGVVEDWTATQLNQVLKSLGLLDDSNPEPGDFVVRGHVAGASAGQVVRAYDRDFRSEELLGESAIGNQGEYEIHYNAEQFQRAEKSTADLRVAVCTLDGRELMSSDIHFNTGPETTIDLIIEPTTARPSEYEQHMADLEKVLEGVTLLEIATEEPEKKEKDLDFLAGDTGIDRQHIEWLIKAAAFEEKSKSVDPSARIVPAPLFYGWFREDMPTEWEPLQTTSITTLRSAARAAIAHAIIPAELEASIESSLDAVPNPQRDALRAAVTITGLGQETLGTLLQYAGTVGEVNNPLVARLVDEGKIASADAHRMGLGLATHALTGGEEATMAAIVGAKPARWNGRGLQRARDLAALDEADVEKALEDGNVEPPAGTTRATYATQLAGQIAEVFPTDALLHRVTNVSDEVVSAVERVFNSSGDPSGDPELRAFTNLHPGLELGKLVDEASDASAAVAGLKQRVAWVDRARELNPDLDLFAIDYLPESESLEQVRFDGLSNDARSMVVANFKSYQRVQSAGAGALGSIDLLKAGYRSATALARSSPAEIAENTGLPIAEVRSYQAQAENRATDASLTWFAFHDLERDNRIFKHRALLEPPVYLKQLAGYDQLFGSANFCHCEDCQSVLGPAAYFVDLMYFIERHILDPSFKTHGGEQNSLHLRSRREDLWTELELTCENTNTVVPSLDLVIEILEQFIVREKGFLSVNELYEKLTDVDHSIRLPFSLPMERLSILLSHLSISRSEVARAFLLSDTDAATRARIRLGMLPKQFPPHTEVIAAMKLLISTSRLGDLSVPAIRAAEAFFSLWLNANLTLSVIPGETETRILVPSPPVTVLAFSRASGLDRTTLGAVLTGDFVNAAVLGAPARIYLEAGVATPGGVQNDAEVVRNLTAGRLDRFERFVRLWRHVPWTSTELHYVIGRLQKSAMPNDPTRLDETMLVALASLLDIQETLRLQVDELCSLWDDVPSIVLQGELSLLDRAFNQPPFVQQGLWPAANQLINATSAIRARLVAALQISDQDLTILEEALDVCLGGINVAGWLNTRNLSLLYRYARLARLLKLSIEELLQTITLTASIASKPSNDRCISSLTDLQAVLEVHRWRAISGFSLPEVLFVSKGVSSLTGYEDPDVLAAAIADEVAAEKALQISLDLFTQIGLTQSESSGLVSDNSEPVAGQPTLLEQVPGGDSYRIRRAIGINDVAMTFLFDPQASAARIAGVAADIFDIVTLGGSAGIEPTALENLGLSSTEAIALVNANLSTNGDGKPFEQIGTTSFYRLRVTEEAAIARFGTEPQDVVATKSILLYRARDLVVRNHAGVAQEIYRIIKRSGDAGIRGRDLAELGLSEAEGVAFLFLNSNTPGTPVNYLRPFEYVPPPPAPLPAPPVHYRLRVSEQEAIAAYGSNPVDFDTTKNILRFRCVDLLLRHHEETVLAAKAATAVRLSPEKTVALLNLAMPGTAAERQLLIDGLQGGSLQMLVTVLERLTRYAVLFKSAAYDSQAIDFVRANQAALAFSEPPTAETVRRVSIYAALAATPDQAYQPDAPTIDASRLQSVLMWTASIADATTDARWTQVAPALRVIIPRQAPKTITGATWATTGTATYTSAGHGYAVGDTVEVAGVTPSGYNLPAGVVTSPTTDKFSVAVSSDPGTYKSGGIAQRFTEEIKAILSAISFASGTSRVDELSQAASALALTRRLGVAAEILKLIVSEDHAQLTKGAEGVFGAIRAKYPDEKTFHEKLEPFEDKLRSRNRDGLVEYLLSAPDDATTDWRKRFTGANDLYYHFLTDVMVEGCARTSRVVAAISSVQLYVHRVLMNLEQSTEDPPLVVALDDASRQEEWKWRKNFQVWVANRKVFLYPESYIEPSLRDDKTPLFKELEDTLLQQQITEQNVLDAYAEYLHGFEEVSRLHIAGAYHDRHYDDKQQPTGDLLHLFGVTASEPPVYYYRTISNLENSKGPVFSAWKKMNLQIPVRKVSPIVYLGRLYVFWVETTTRALNEFTNGSSKFTGYRHSVRTKFSQLRLDDRWTAPQAIQPEVLGVTAGTRTVDDILYCRFKNVGTPGTPDVYIWVTDDVYEAFLHGGGYELVSQIPLWDPLQRDHREPIEGYAPMGSDWERVYPQVGGFGSGVYLTFGPRNNGEIAVSVEAVDFWKSTLSTLVNGTNTYYAAFQKSLLNPFNSPGMYLGQYLPYVDIVNGIGSSLLLEAGEQVFFLQYLDSGGYRARRLSTSMVEQMGKHLVVDGIKGMLDVKSQGSLVEADSTLLGPIFDLSELAEFPYKGNAFQGYFREVFLHIPFLIADSQNSQQKFADAQRWYHYLYNPTASEPGADEKKRPWRYREFREQVQEIWSLRKALTDANSLAAYRQDPFNPHAIARLRPGAYQKAIFMKYVDNLLDWGDALFSQFTMESVNEATMLYVMAADILGPRPTELGPCGETSGSGKTYDDIAPYLRPADPNAEPTTDFLIEEFETFTLNWKERYEIGDEFIVNIPTVFSTISQAATASLVGAPAEGVGIATFDNISPTLEFGVPNPAGWNQPGATIWKEGGGTTLADLHSGNPLGGSVVPLVGGEATPRLPLSGDPVGPPDGSFGGITLPGLPGNLGGPNGFTVDDYLLDVVYDLGDAPPQYVPPQNKKPPAPKPFELAQARLVFCIPENKELRGYWDRVEDRLNKIRNCMDMAGVRRRLELFAPEIDPHMLVRMRAAGLSLDDVLNVTSGNLPPYRFTYLIEKAKQHAGLVQNFGNQVLSAVEKRDGEELLRLRTVHEQNLLKLRSQMTQWEIDAAEDTLESLRRQKTAVEYRRDHYATLSQTGLSGFERVQQIGTHIASGLHDIEATVHILSAVLSLVPQLGAPTAIVYGGIQLGGGAAAMAHVNQALAQASAAASTSAGLEATFQRRDEDWKHQVELAKKELDQLDQQITAAEIRRDIAQQSLTVHDKSVDQVQEIFDFLRDRFTKFGLFTWLSAELQKLHRMAFNAALSMARLAEQACHFEHPDEAVQATLTGDYWDAGNAGLLAGDRLMLDLHNLERRYIETHHRTLEIEQSFSVARFDPDALSKLKTECVCDFEIPEWFFDLTYPGHYRRRIKAVRLTIPCVVGPHTNVGATLRLNGSHIRKEAQLDSTVSVPLRHMTAIAASMGQSDAGVFEFSFRDERYMPFEGAGVNSQWQLRLPAAVKPFDYSTISDVILHLSYTAEEDEDLRKKAEATNGVLTQLATTGVTRIFSLRSDFPNAWYMLLQGILEVEIEIRDVHIPFFMSGFDLDTAQFDVLTDKLTSAGATYPSINSFHDTAVADPDTDGASGLYRIGRTGKVTVVSKHVIKITDFGTASIPSTGGGPPRLDDSKIKDILLRVTLKGKPPPAP